jgi:23S rRNA (guanosine2251-2'-O)-methyltransferase
MKTHDPNRPGRPRRAGESRPAGQGGERPRQGAQHHGSHHGGQQGGFRGEGRSEAPHRDDARRGEPRREAFQKGQPRRGEHAGGHGGGQGGSQGGGYRKEEGSRAGRTGGQYSGQYGGPSEAQRGRQRPAQPSGQHGGQERRPWARQGEERPAAAFRGADRPQARGDAPRPARGGDSARSGLWLYGQHAVAAALANPARRLRRLLLTEEAEAALAAKLPPPWSLPPERVARDRLDHLLGRDAVHQGMALLADPLAPPALAQMLERGGPVLVLDQVTDPRNVGAILRSAAAFGAAGVITQERNAPEETGALAKAASGALERVPLLRAVNIARTLVALKAAGCWIVGLDAGAPPLSGPALAGRQVALVLGAEGEGLRRLTRETCDELGGLSMPGGMESLNVSAAATVALYELSRRA